MAWQPERYEQFLEPRLRPGRDLLAAIPDIAPARIVDLGCGTGRLTRLLAERWPKAQVVGVDGSAEILAKAATIPSAPGGPGVAWELGDIARWQAPEPVDLIFSNAALHWVTGHDSLFPELLANLAPGGVLAVQMPHNFAAPSHALMREVAAEGPWADTLHGAFAKVGVHPPEVYWRWLSPIAARVDIWETEYLHVLDGADPVLDWVRSTGLLPVLERLQGEMLDGYVAAYGARLRAAYPPERDGHTLFPFRRLFLVVRV